MAESFTDSVISGKATRADVGRTDASFTTVQSTTWTLPSFTTFTTRRSLTAPRPALATTGPAGSIGVQRPERRRQSAIDIYRQLRFKLSMSKLPVAIGSYMLR